MSPASLFPPDLDAATVFVLFLSILLVGYVSSFLHELGHALLGHWSGFVVSSFGVGTGRIVAAWDWRGTRVYLGLSGWHALTCIITPQIYPTRRQLLAFYSGGLWANALLVLIGLVFWRNGSWGGPLWPLLVALNALWLVVNLLPIKVRFGSTVLHSDGWGILETLRSGMLRTDLPGQINTLRALQPLLAAIRDARGQYYYLLGGACVWEALGNAARARQLLEEAAALPVKPAPFGLAYEALCRGEVACAASEPATAEILDEAARRFAELGHEAGQFLTAWARANLLARQGDAATVTQLEALASHPVAAARPPLRASLLADRLCALARVPEATGLEELLKEYEAGRKVHPSATHDLKVYKAVAASRQRQGRGEAAERARAQAREAARQVDRAFSLEEDRAYFRQGQADLAQPALVSAASGAEGERGSDALWATAEEWRQEEAAAQKRRTRLLLGIGWLLIAVSLAVGAMLAAPLLSAPLPRPRNTVEQAALFERLGPPVLLVGGAVVSAALSLSWLLLAWWVPSLRRLTGAVTCYISLLPLSMLLLWWLGLVPRPQ